MPVELSALTTGISPEQTLLFFGAGSSIPSGSPSSQAILDRISVEFGIANDRLTLAEASLLAEIKSDRKRLITCVRSLFKKPQVTGGLLNMPLYKWKSLYTTNFDELIEGSYRQADVELTPLTTNFDFSKLTSPDSAKLYKIHGTINQDVSDGSQSRLIITQADYDKAEEYRDFIYDKFAADLAGSHLVIIGYSLADPDIRAIVDRALSIQTKLAGAGGRISLLLFERDFERAALFEHRGLKIAFGGVNEFFASLANNAPSVEQDTELCSSPIDQHPRLRAVTIDVDHAARILPADFSKMFNGSPATYADIAAELTFTRSVGERVAGSLRNQVATVCVLLGASGVGKTTAARQTLLQMKAEGWLVWEHRSDFDLNVDDWVEVARSLEILNENALLLVDDAHSQIHRLNEFAERLETSGVKSLRLLLVSTKHHWGPRYKTPALNKLSNDYQLSRLSTQEVDRLLRLVEHSDTIRPLVEETFSGYTVQERRRRLVERCSSDMFVCLKNIFATEKFDDIILREFAEIEPKYREVYRVVAAMEHAGIRVHRQLIIRLLGVPADQVQDLLDHLDEIVSEYDVLPREGIYGWKVRHAVIAAIIVKYKFIQQAQMVALFENVIGAISPAYEIELRTIREICNVDTGIPSIPDKKVQNKLLRKMISMAPGERVPRHRLIRNLIDLGQYDVAETEIRLFSKDLGRDGPLARYQLNLLVARANDTPGLLTDDRVAILIQARELATAFVTRYSQNKTVHGANCDLGLAWYKLTQDRSVFDEAIETLKEAELKYADPEMTQLVRKYERRGLGEDLVDLAEQQVKA